MTFHEANAVLSKEAFVSFALSTESAGDVAAFEAIERARKTQERRVERLLGAEGGGAGGNVDEKRRVLLKRVPSSLLDRKTVEYIRETKLFVEEAVDVSEAFLDGFCGMFEKGGSDNIWPSTSCLEQLCGWLLYGYGLRQRRTRC
jgi:hypothetical protein